MPPATRASSAPFTQAATAEGGEAGDTNVAGKQSLDDQRAAGHVDKLRFELVLLEQSGAFTEIKGRLEAGDRDVGDFESLSRSEIVRK